MTVNPQDEEIVLHIDENSTLTSLEQLLAETRQYLTPQDMEKI